MDSGVKVTAGLVGILEGGEHGQGGFLGYELVVLRRVGGGFFGKGGVGAGFFDGERGRG